MELVTKGGGLPGFTVLAGARGGKKKGTGCRLGADFPAPWGSKDPESEHCFIGFSQRYSGKNYRRKHANLFGL